MTFHERTPLMPDAPSILEAGRPKFQIGPWFALVGPADLLAEIVQRMNKEMVAALANPKIRQQMNLHGFIPKRQVIECVPVCRGRYDCIRRSARDRVGDGQGVRLVE
jgi:Tripartite tricarboxylate transporter family receptor